MRGGQLVGAQRAVDAHGRGPRSRQRHRRSLWRGAQEREAVLPKGHGAHNGDVYLLFYGDEGGFGLQQVTHGLDDHQVGIGGGDGFALLAIERLALIHAHGSQWLQEGARGPHICRHIAGPSPASQPHCPPIDLRHRSLALKLAGVGPKGAGGDHVCAGFHIGPMDACHQLRILKKQQLRNCSRLHAPRLQHGPHGAVQQQERLARQRPAQQILGTRGGVQPLADGFLGSGGSLWRMHHESSVSLRPMRAVTDFCGTIQSWGVRVMPRVFCASRASRRAGWTESGKSP